jgi:hypothetical protein
MFSNPQLEYDVTTYMCAPYAQQVVGAAWIKKYNYLWYYTKKRGKINLSSGVAMVYGARGKKSEIMNLKKD